MTLLKWIRSDPRHEIAFHIVYLQVMAEQRKKRRPYSWWEALLHGMGRIGNLWP